MDETHDLEAQAKKPDITVSTNNIEDGEISAAVSEKRRVKYVDDGHGNTVAAAAPHTLTRQLSTQSIQSIRSTRDRIRKIDPSVGLPIHYRTVSYNIEDGEKKQKAEVGKDKATQEISDADWHTLSHMDICKILKTDTSAGLSAADVREKVAEFGRNVPSKPPSQLARKIFGYCFGGFGSILLIGAVLVFISWKPLGNPPAQANLALAIVLVVVFVIQAAFNAWQDFSSSRVMNSITGMLPEDCLVLRDGHLQTIQAPDVVPGDIMHFSAGKKLSADIRFVDVSSDARFDRSILTGESQPLAAVTESTDPNYLETRCIGMQGTICTCGSGVGIVVSTGDRTVFGHIAELTSTPSTERTPLQKEILRFVLIIVFLMLVMDLVVIAVWAGYIRHAFPNYMPPATLIVNLVSIAIAFVPEGLPIALTASLTIIANIMKKNNILCKSLKTVETLGAVSVLLSDKTGTLTKNQMNVTDCMIGLSTIKMADAVRKYENSDASSASSIKSSLDQLRTAAAVNNAGEFDPTTMHLPVAERTITADATDQAILRMSECLAPVSAARNIWRKRFDLAFNSKNKFALRFVSATDKSGPETALSDSEAARFSVAHDYLLLIKGAPDVLIGRCTSYVGEDGDVYDLDQNVRASIEATKDDWSSQGKRVLLLARKVVPGSQVYHDTADGEFEEEAQRHARHGLVLIGLAGIVDPPRDEIPSVIDTLKTAGIRTMMVTGDFKLTAQAIARMCGIISVPDSEVNSVKDLSRDASSSESSPSGSARSSMGNRKAIVLSGPELITLNAHQWEELTQYSEVVFARTTPDQKLRIVKEFKARGNIVAMTGDGVNDAPSLKEADIGIAPGSGSDIAIEAADMVLLDSFSAIVQAVLYGRVVYDNLKKTVAYLLPAGSFSEFWPVMTSVIFGLPQILSSFLMIIICCFTDCAAATVLAYEKPEADVLLRPPRDVRKDKLVDWRLLLQSYGLFGCMETLCAFSMSYWWLQINGVPFSSLWFSYGTYNVPTGLSADEVVDRLNIGSSIYFITLVVMQMFTIMAIRTQMFMLAHTLAILGDLDFLDVASNAW